MAARWKGPHTVWVFVDDYGQLCEVFSTYREAAVYKNTGTVVKYVRVQPKPKKSTN